MALIQGHLLFIWLIFPYCIAFVRQESIFVLFKFKNFYLCAALLDI